MALTPQFAAPVQLTPAPQRNPAALASPLVEGAGMVLEAVDKAQQVNARADEQIADIDARIAKHQRDEADNMLVFKQSAAFAQVEERLRVDAANAKLEAGADAAGYAKRVTAAVDKRLSEFDAGFGQNERVRQKFIDNQARLRARYGGDAQIYEMGEKAKFQATTAEQVVDGTVNAMRLHVTENGADTQFFADGVAKIDVMVSALPPAAQPEARRQFLARYGQNFIEALLDGNHTDQADALMKSGFFSNILTPQQFEAAGKGVALNRQKAAREAELAASEERKRAGDALDLVKAQIAAGIVPENMPAVVAAARAAGVKEAEIFDVEAANGQISLLRTFETRGAEETQRYVDALQAKVLSGKATAEEQFALETLKDIPDKKRDTEAAALREQWESGAQGQMAIVAQLSGKSAAERYRLAAKVDPEGSFAVQVGLKPPVIAMALQGKAYRKADSKLVPDAEMRKAFAKYVGNAAYRIDPPTQMKMMQGAGDLYAKLASDAGAKEWNPEIYHTALKMQFGMTQEGGVRRGGLGSYQGKPVILPENRSEEDFEATVARLDFSAARAKGGLQLSKQDVLRYFTPQWAGEGKDVDDYRFIDARGHELKNKSGKTFIMRVSK